MLWADKVSFEIYVEIIGEIKCPNITVGPRVRQNIFYFLDFLASTEGFMDI